MSVMNIITRHISPILNYVKGNFLLCRPKHSLHIPLLKCLYVFWRKTWVQKYGIFGLSQLYRTERRHPLS